MLNIPHPLFFAINSKNLQSRDQIQTFRELKRNSTHSATMEPLLLWDMSIRARSGCVPTLPASN